VKQNIEKAEKYLMADVEPLIDSILKANYNLTEELICLNLGYNGGYISQLRSREKATGEPQVSQKFFNQLKNFGLQNANYNLDESPLNLVKEPDVEYGVKGKSSTGKDAIINALLEEKDRAIKKAEESALKAEEVARKMELHYEDAKADKDKLFKALDKLQTTFDETLRQISENIKDAAINLKSNHDHLLAISRTVRANDAEILEGLDHLEGNTAGTRQKRSHIVQKALREGVEAGAGDKKTGTGKIGKDVNEQS
jgi:hypothetical protein